MNTVTIPKKLAQNGDLIVVPRKEYEALIELSAIKEFTPTKIQKQALVQAEANLKNRKTLSFHELAQKLGFAN